METEALFPTEEKPQIAIDATIKKFFADCKARKLSPATISKYDVLLEKQLKGFVKDKGLRFLHELTVERLREFRQTWPDGPLSAYKKNERLRSFFKWCLDSEYVDDNPAERVKPPRIERTKVKTFSPQEWYAILNACDEYDPRGIYGADNRTRLKAFILLLRYSGLRIRDVVVLKRTAINAKGQLYLRTTKTGQPVWLPLPPAVIKALEALPENGPHYFWTGNGLPKSAVADWQRSLRKLFALADVKGHAHMFRHSFASELIVKGVSIETVAEILGNSPAVVRKHYSHFSPVWQKAIEDAVAKTWD
jgi:integrase